MVSGADATESMKRWVSRTAESEWGMIFLVAGGVIVVFTIIAVLVGFVLPAIARLLWGNERRLSFELVGGDLPEVREFSEVRDFDAMKRDLEAKYEDMAGRIKAVKDTGKDSGDLWVEYYDNLAEDLNKLGRRIDIIPTEDGVRVFNLRKIQKELNTLRKKEGVSRAELERAIKDWQDQGIYVERRPTGEVRVKRQKRTIF